jgi:hypothetical protein
MNRPPVRPSPAQLQNLANLSRAQAMAAASRQELDTKERELARSFASAKEELDRNAAALEKHYGRSNRYGHWLARAALIPVLVLAVLMVVMVVRGLWNGEIKEVHKYSKLYVSRAGNPVAYWLSAVYHGMLAAVTVWIGVLIFRLAKIRRKNLT